MGYKIEKEGFEMYGFKLGQMTKQGRIIGFDENDRQYGIVVEGNSNSLVRMSTGITIVLEGCEDCKYEYVNKNLINQPKISIRHEIWNTTLIVQTLHCKPFKSVEKEGFELTYKNSTILCKSYADVGCKEGSCDLDTLHFNTHIEAQSYLDTLLELIEMVNNPVPVVDLSRVEDYFFGDYKIISNAYQVQLLKGLVTVQSWNVYIVSLPIIKQQLEQILAHLNVKCVVRI